MPPIVLYDLHPSPNSKKVRLALGYKGIAHETIAVDPMDRASIVAVSGQPLTPVLKHGDTVIFDSAAILRYLEANVKREPRLYSADYDTMKAIERWEAQGGRDFGPPVGTMFGQFFTGSPDPTVLAKAAEDFNAAARSLEKSLNSDGFLVGSAPTAGDITCAAWIGLSVLSPEQQSKHPIMAYFAENLRLDPECQRLRTWYRGLDKYDV